jgi:amidophosphoribosyltransferase
VPNIEARPPAEDGCSGVDLPVDELHRKFEEACGVVGFIALGSLGPEDLSENSTKIVRAAEAIQGRGQQSAGASATDHELKNTTIVERGLVEEVFPDGEFIASGYRTLIAHTLWSTDSSPDALSGGQPFENSVGDLTTRTAKNGQIPLPYNSEREFVTDSHKVGFDITTEIASRREDESHFDGIRNAIVKNNIDGSFSLVMEVIDGEDEALYAIRDPRGIRPLVYGHSKKGSVVGSVTGALEAFDAMQVGDVPAGWIYRFDRDGGVQGAKYAEAAPGMCVFEHVYLLPKDHRLAPGVTVQDRRRRMGELLSGTFNEYQIRGMILDKNVVIVPMPDTAIPAAQGLSMALGVPEKYDPTLIVKNQNSSRSYLGGNGDDAKAIISDKFIYGDVRGKKLVVVDDSTIRGTTSTLVNTELQKLGAAEIHVVVTLPRVEYDCNLGANIHRSEAIAPGRTNEEIAKEIAATSFRTLSLEKLSEAIETPQGELCTGCLDEEYATNKPAVYIEGNLKIETVKMPERDKAGVK